MTTSDKIKIGLQFALVILVTVMIVSMFNKNKGNNPDHTQELLKEKDDKIKALENDNYNLANELQFHMYADSILAIKQQQVKTRKSEISTIINDFDKEQLRRGLSGY